MPKLQYIGPLGGVCVNPKTGSSTPNDMKNFLKKGVAIDVADAVATKLLGNGCFQLVTEG